MHMSCVFRFLKMSAFSALFLIGSGCVPRPLPRGDSPGPRPVAPPPLEVKKVPAMAPVRHPAPKRVVQRIVVDPGHGGKDPGAVGVRGTEEKTINLLLAQDLAELLRARDYEVLLTRTDDRFIPLEERSRLANTHNADLFVSLHCNASLSSKLKGFEVYFLSEFASDPHADAVARLENASLTLEEKAPKERKEVASVLRSLAKTGYINESSEFGALVDRRAAKALSQPHLGVKQAEFHVLKGAEMPAVLIETAFISNPKEEKLLRNEVYRAKLIRAIADAIDEYNQRKGKLKTHG